LENKGFKNLVPIKGNVDRLTDDQARSHAQKRLEKYTGFKTGRLGGNNSLMLCQNLKRFP
jgi:hypothetical protein